jgi:hypothetical protein
VVETETRIGRKQDNLHTSVKVKRERVKKGTRKMINKFRWPVQGWDR